MIRIAGPNTTSTRALVMGALVAGAFGLGLFQGTPPPVPIHAAAKANGNGWECDAGYLEVGADCTTGLQGPSHPSEPDREAIARRTGATLSVAEQNVGLRKMIEELSLENAVLRSELHDGR